ncbi:CD48 antigen [Coregonus clupeaformis]|uniref:CD48 antigen n=1 Tax=Coregonus clupeaformis TaxID=59861 RepID=UPI001E1C9A94|nr:CD48 antigen [Coregonus clupeaformis]
MACVVLSLLTILPVVMGDTTGYLGDSVTLSSGANISWGLSKIEWSIFKNVTWIATYQKSTESLRTDRFWQFKSRLKLNFSSGDLEIRDVRKEDSLVYSVLLQDSAGEQHNKKFQLTVTERLSKPNVHKVFSVLRESHCVMALQCSSSQKDTHLSWEPVAAFNDPFWRGNPNTNVSVVWTSYSPNRDANFTCTASNGHSKASRVVTERCQEEQPKPDVVGETRIPGIAFGMLLLGFLFGCVFTYIYFKKSEGFK